MTQTWSSPYCKILCEMNECIIIQCFSMKVTMVYGKININSKKTLNALEKLCQGEPIITGCQLDLSHQLARFRANVTEDIFFRLLCK